MRAKMARTILFLLFLSVLAAQQQQPLTPQQRAGIAAQQALPAAKLIVGPFGSQVNPHAIFARTVRARGYHPVVVMHAVNGRPLGGGISMEAQRDFLGPAPGPAYVFVPGYYWLNVTRFVWIEPVWALPPSPGAIWVPPNWAYNGSDWTLQEGYWQSPHASVAPPEQARTMQNPAQDEPRAVFGREVRGRAYRPAIVAQVPIGFGAPPVAMALREQRSIAGPAPSPNFSGLMHRRTKIYHP
jgi:hypothetical protein